MPGHTFKAESIHLPAAPQLELVHQRCLSTSTELDTQTCPTWQHDKWEIAHYQVPQFDLVWRDRPCLTLTTSLQQSVSRTTSRKAALLSFEGVSKPSLQVYNVSSDTEARTV